MNWIKMRCCLHENPKVLAISKALDTKVLSVVGMLWRIWSWADHHSVDGQLAVDSMMIDGLVDCPGFAAAMRNVGWLSGDEGKLTLPNFEEHNGHTAKRRCDNQARKGRVRRINRDPADIPTKSSATDEQQKAFESFWSEYPKKVAREDALNEFLAGKCQEHIQKIIESVKAKRSTSQWCAENGRFIPNPATFLKRRSWEEPATVQTFAPKYTKPEEIIRRQLESALVK